MHASADSSEADGVQWLDCRVMQDEVNQFFDMHVKSLDGKKFDEEIASEEMAKRVLERFYASLDPERMILFHDEYEAETATANLLDVEMVMIERDACKVFVGKFNRFSEAIDRHAGIMGKVMRDEQKLFAEVEAMVEDKDKFYKELLPSIAGFPADESGLRHKAKVYFAKRYLVFKTAEYSDEEAFATTLRVVEQLRNNYDYRDSSSLYSLVAKSIVGSVELHTQLYSEKEYEDFMETVLAGFAGLGVRLMEAGKGLRVVGVIPGGPADVQKILFKGDVIVSIDGDFEAPLKGLASAISLLKGSPGAEVTLGVLRDGQLLKDVKAVRGLVSTNNRNITAEIKKVNGKSLGFISFDSFYSPYVVAKGDLTKGNIGSDGGAFARAPGVADDIKDELTRMKDAGVSGVVIDLRGNGGGSLNQVRRLVGLFIPYGPVVSVRTVNEEELEMDQDNEFLFSEPVVVLIDAGSASASEIFAGAMQDYNRAVVIGAQRSFGKGSVQVLKSLAEFVHKEEVFPGAKESFFSVPFRLKGGLKITESYYYLPSGRPVQYVGVSSDVVLPSLKVGDYLESTTNPRLTAPEAARNLFEDPVTDRVGHEYGKWMTDQSKAQAIQQVKASAAVVIAQQDKLSVDDMAIKVLFGWVEAVKSTNLQLATR